MNIRTLYMVGGAIAGLALLWAIFWWLKRRPGRLKTDYFEQQWQELQKLCAHPETWPQTIITADKLLDEALKKMHLHGKSIGERLVAAQRQISNNDEVWYGHNLCKSLLSDANLKLREADVKRALLGFRQALKDLGALKKNSNEQSEKG